MKKVLHNIKVKIKRGEWNNLSGENIWPGGFLVHCDSAQARAPHLEGLLELGFCRLDPSIGRVKPQARLDPSLVVHIDLA